MYKNQALVIINLGNATVKGDTFIFPKKIKSTVLEKFDIYIARRRGKHHLTDEVFFISIILPFLVFIGISVKIIFKKRW